jgi:transposase
MMKKEEKKKPLLTVAQVAKKIGRTKATIYRWIKEEGAVHTVHYIGLRPYKMIDLSEFTAWLKARQENQTARKG